MPTASWTATADAGELRPLRDALAAFLVAYGLDGEALQDVRLAVSEAVSNVVRHAYPGREAGPLSVEAAISGADVRITVADRGHGLRPRPDSPGAGLGLPMMARLATQLDVREREGGGTEVLLRFARPGTAAARAA